VRLKEQDGLISPKCQGKSQTGDEAKKQGVSKGSNIYYASCPWPGTRPLVEKVERLRTILIYITIF
jgi:hypothetical protein